MSCSNERMAGVGVNRVRINTRESRHPHQRGIGRLGAMVWAQWDEVRHAGSVMNLNDAVKNAQAGRARLPEVTDTVADDEQTQTSMRELERLIEAMQRHWFLRKYVHKTNPPPSRALSENAAPERKPEGAPFAGRFCELRSQKAAYVSSGRVSGASEFITSRIGDIPHCNGRAWLLTLTAPPLHYR